MEDMRGTQINYLPNLILATFPNMLPEILSKYILTDLTSISPFPILMASPVSAQRPHTYSLLSPALLSRALIFMPTCGYYFS